MGDCFEGDVLEENNSFAPKKLTSKNQSIFDCPDKSAPTLVILKVDPREALEKSVGWKNPDPEEVVTKLKENLKIQEKLIDVKFPRAYLPEGAVSKKKVEKAYYVLKKLWNITHHDP